jgi:uncharacterized MnhB-related membrane protein
MRKRISKGRGIAYFHGLHIAMTAADDALAVALCGFARLSPVALMTIVFRMGRVRSGDPR